MIINKEVEELLEIRIDSIMCKIMFEINDVLKYGYIRNIWKKNNKDEEWTF